MWLPLPRLAVALSPLLAACGAAGMAHQANVITAPELSRSQARNAYDAIRRIRPELLRSRDPGSIVYFRARRPLVAVDNALVGDVEVLRAIRKDDVARIEYVNSWAAAKLYGRSFSNGLLLIETVPSSGPRVAER